LLGFGFPLESLQFSQQSITLMLDLQKVCFKDLDIGRLVG
jgi:hypothetical protein